MTASRRIVTAVFLSGALVGGVFVLPYWFPPSSPILSASMLAGFNNALAYDVYVVVLGLLAYVLAPFVAKPHVLGALTPSRPLFRVPSWPAVAIIVGHIVLFTALYLRRHAFVFAEALYFEDAAYRVSAGQLPFVDFIFFYGPLFVFPTAILGRYAGILLAYGIVYVMAYVAGLYLLYVVMDALVAERRRLNWWFALLAVGFFNPITGLNYTFGRFLLPIVSLLAVWQCQAAFTIRRWWLAVALVGLAILCSPDIAAVTVIGSGLLIAASGIEAWRSSRIQQYAAIVAIPGVALIVAVVPLLLLDGTWGPVFAYVKPIATFSSGGWSTPIDPSLPMLTGVGLTALACAILVAGLANPRDRERRPLVAAFGITLLLMQRAIFGKADVLHIIYSGLPAFLVVVAWQAAAVERRAPRWIGAAMIIGLMIPLQFYHAMLFVPSLMARFEMSEVAHASTDAPATAKADIQASLATAVDRFGDDRLYYMHKLEYYRLPIYLERRLKPFLHHPSLTSAFTKEDIEDVIGELKQGGAVVLARRTDLMLSGPPAPLPTRWPYYAMSAPLPGSTVFNLTTEFQWRLEKPLIEFLTTAYDTTFEDGEIVGLVLKSDSTRPAHALQ